MAESNLTAQRVRELLHYDPLTGVLTWRTTRGCVRAGAEAGCRKRGYIVIKIDGFGYQGHRVAWIWVHGEWPPMDLDHRDTVRAHNWIENLRPATQTMNSENLRRAQKNNRVGVLGVSMSRGKFMARIRVAGKLLYLGRFDTAPEAGAVYLAAKREKHAGCTL